MSRSALWRQDGAKKQREQEAEEIFELAVEEGRNNRAKNLLPLWGPDDSFHFNPMLLQNIIKSSYFQKCCRDLLDWNTLVDEIYYKVTHLEPWAVGSNREPSVCFCLLLRLLTLRCTEKQMQLLLDHPDSPYIRGIGFLYLRYVCDPKIVWNWIEPYIHDDELISVAANAQKNNHISQRSNRHPTTVGEFVQKLFSTERDYYGTMLPRLPTQIERDIQVNLLLAEKIEKRANKHLSNPKTMGHFQTLGAQVMALYGDEENPTTWYEAIVDRVITRDEQTSEPLRSPKFVVTFPEYGNTEMVTLGEMEMRGVPLDPVNACRTNDGGYDPPSRGGYGRHSDERRRGGRPNAPSTSRDINDSYQSRGLGEDDLYEEVRRRERDSVASSGSRASRRPPSAKESLSAPAPDTSRMENDLDWRRDLQPSSSYSAHRRDDRQKHPAEDSSATQTDGPAPKKRSSEEIAAIQEKKRKLVAKYG